MGGRSWKYRYRIRALLAVIAIVSILLAFWKSTTVQRYYYHARMESAGARFEFAESATANSLTGKISRFVFGPSARNLEIAVFGGLFVNRSSNVIEQIVVPHDAIDYANLALFSELKELDLSSTGTNDRDLVHITNLKQLKILRLDGSAISDKGLQILSALKSLELLSVSNTPTTQHGIEALATVLPHCSIVSEPAYIKYDDPLRKPNGFPDRTLMSPGDNSFR